MQTGGKALHIAFDIIKIIAAAILETGKGFFKFLWECLPTFAELKQTLGSIPPGGVYAIIAGASFGLLGFILKSIKKMRKRIEQIKRGD